MINVNCNNHSLEFVKYICTNGTIQIKKQCLNCGYKEGGNFPHSVVKNIDKLNIYNKELNEKNNNLTYDLKTSFLQAYQNYLNSETWKAKRLLVLQKYKSKCVLCFQTATEIHHLHYVNIFDEKLTDLICLCSNCHTEIHENMDKSKTITKASEIAIMTKNNTYFKYLLPF
jgi:hypothetical protein